jgi:mRNA interferase RelE/StbE
MRSMKIEFAAQVLDFVSSLAPAPRRALRQALRDLAQGKGDVSPLEGELEGLYRLRVGRYRVIFLYRTTAQRRQVRCVFAEHRGIIYEVFAQHLHEHLE